MASRYFRPVIRNSSLSYRPELDGLRAIAITAVVLSHIKLFNYGSYGVDFFFVLSGYLITDVLLRLRDRKRGLKIFWVGRIARLTPILVINVVIGSVLSYFFLSTTFHFLQPLSALVYVKNFYILSPLNHDVWAPTWTLAAEEQFYLVWPLVIFFLAKRMQVKTLILIALMYFLGIHGLIDISNYVYGFQHPPGVMPGDLAGIVVQVVIRPSEILLGALITLHKKLSVGPPIVVYFIAVNFAAILLGAEKSTKAALLSGLLLSILELKNLLSRVLRRILSFKPLVLLGILSYSIYLWHTLVFELIFVNFGVSILSRLIIVVLTIVISYVSFAYIETPVQIVIKKRILS